MARIFKKFAFFVFCLGFCAAFLSADHWILDAKVNKLPKNFLEKIEMVGGKLVKSWDFLGIAVVEFPDEKTAFLFEEQGFRVMPDVYADWIPDEGQFATLHLGEDETYYGYQWHLPLIQADMAWETGLTGSGVRIAVLDSGIYYPHPDLGSNVDFASSATFVPGTTDFIDDLGHGSWVAGIIAAADNGWGAIGVAPNATLIAVKVMNSSGEGAFSWIIGGLIHAVMVDADIINMSIGTLLPKGRFTASLCATANKLMNWAAAHDVLVVTAAGNENLNLNHSRNNVYLPAEAGNCIAISATGPADLPAYYTNYGTSLVWVAAPGGDSSYGLLGNVFSTFYTPPGETGYWFAWMDGTSGSAPNAAGVAALIIEKYGRMSVGKLKNILKNTADDLGKPGADDYYGRGRVNAYKAVTKK
ncbi:MAG: S8 family serine peptidase [Candidatus Hodarchaeota archaeon]